MITLWKGMFRLRHSRNMFVELQFFVQKFAFGTFLYYICRKHFSNKIHVKIIINYE